MGYCSEVRALIYGPADKLTAHIAAWQLQHTNELFAFYEGSLKRYRIEIGQYNSVAQQWEYTEGECLDLFGDSWKWYEDYREVKLWEEFMRLSSDMGLEWEFIRIGEETTDVVCESSGNAQSYLVTTSPTITNYINRVDKADLKLLAL